MQEIKCAGSVLDSDRHQKTLRFLLTQAEVMA